MGPLIIYHTNCDDGFTAAWLAWLHLERENIEFHPAQYGDDPPDVTGREVYIFDFSYPKDILLDMQLHAKSIIVLDHHKTAEENLKGLDFCEFDMNRSGAMMAWDFFSSGEEAPQLVKYVQDRDLWQFGLNNSKEVSAYMRSFSRTIASWNHLNKMIEENFGLVVMEGTAIHRYETRLAESLANRARLVTIEGQKERVLAVNSPILQSEIGEILANRGPYGITYFHNGERLIFSARSRRDDFDVSEIARTQGGGGHKRAAGWRGERLDIFTRGLTF